MFVKTDQTALKYLRRRSRRSERDVAEEGGLSRATLRQVEAGATQVRLSSISKVAEVIGKRLQMTIVDDAADSNCSTVAIGFKILRDGEASWKIHLMDFVDEFRRTLDGRLICLPPPQVSPKIDALIASTVIALCLECESAVPVWANALKFLNVPWFVAEVESLKAFALLESPLPYRRNNIFVLNNFLDRA